MREMNEWEAEEWFFYIPVEGNEKGIHFLQEIFSDFEDGDEDTNEYSLTGAILTEQEVDALVKYGGEGYMNNHNKLEGNLDFERLKTDIETIGLSESISKGDIINYMIKNGK